MGDAHSRLRSDLEALRDLPLFVAYNANVDALVGVDADLEAFLDRPDGVPGETTPPNRLTSKRDLATAITRTMAAGEGDEIAMSAELATLLEAELAPDREQMGGQAGIMTNLLSALGAAPVVYTYLLSETQLSMFDRPDAVRFPLVDDGRVRFVPLERATNTDRTKINWIFEFRKGAELFGVRADANTRFIAASRPSEFDLTADGLDPVVDQVGEAVDGALLAGYHNLTRENLDAPYEQVHRHARRVIRRLRSGGDVPVHVEYAVTHDEDLRRSMAEYILPEADVIGLDPRELRLLGGDLGVDVAGVTIDSAEDATDAAGDATDAAGGERGRDSTAILDHYRALSTVRERLGVPCIRMHAMDYHLAVTDDYLPADAVRRGLEFAAINAATKASTGHVRAPEVLETGLEHPPSDAGRDAVRSLADRVGASAEDGAVCTPGVVACPNRVVESPAGTVGIGDIVSSAAFALEVAIADGYDRGGRDDHDDRDDRGGRDDRE